MKSQSATFIPWMRGSIRVVNTPRATHPCVISADRLSRPYCTRPPSKDLGGLLAYVYQRYVDDYSLLRFDLGQMPTKRRSTCQRSSRGTGMSLLHDLPADSTILHPIVHNVQHINVRNYYVGLYPFLHTPTMCRLDYVSIDT